MKLCRVVGNASASLKAPGLEGAKLLILQELDGRGKAAGPVHLAVDAIGAGVQEVVAVVTGSNAARIHGRSELPVDAVVVAIMDHVFLRNREIDTKREED
jgi:microcompartment protein CcmK/EutM